MSELLQISKKLVRAASKWPLSEDRRLDVLRLAKRIRIDAMTDLEIELLIIEAISVGARYADDIVDELGLSRKEVDEILGRMWMQGTLEKASERINGRGRPRTVFMLAADLSFKEKKDSFDDLESPHD